ncbi:MAG: hypothetical protein KUG77_22380 [Nannocystaceae bacterium]|nr:hypothetical protein [Nannocystaceae bacterium]
MTSQAEQVISALELGARRSGSCTHCAVSLPHLAKTLPAAAEGLQRMSKARAQAAALDARTLAQRVRHLPGQTDASAAIALDDFAAAVQGHLESANEPNRLGKAVLQRQLEVEENLGESATDLFKGLGLSLIHI